MKKMIVGLGNYGKVYDGTRHNVGFEVLDGLAKEAWKPVHSCMISKADDILLVKPMAGMNVCGSDVEYIRSSFNFSIKDVIVVHDEMDFDPGTMRIKFSGGDGKHNGLKTLIKHMGPDFCRVRIGIGKPKKNGGLDFVLGIFPKHERKLIDSAITDAVAAVNIIAKEDVQSAMMFFNRKKI